MSPPNAVSGALRLMLEDEPLVWNVPVYRYGWFVSFESFGDVAVSVHAAVPTTVVPVTARYAQGLDSDQPGYFTASTGISGVKGSAVTVRVVMSTVNL